MGSAPQAGSSAAEYKVNLDMEGRRGEL